jgi:secreted trypsin-like serine protease
MPFLGSTVLKQVNLTIYPNEFCTNVSPSVIKNWNAQICCGDINGERDACQGDSGGGLYIPQNLSNIFHYTIDGIVSYGEQCASPMKPGIYTRVSNYIDWIQTYSDFDITNI